VTSLSISVPTVGQSFSTEGVKVGNSLTNLSSWAAGSIDGVNLDASVTGRRLLHEATAFLGAAAGSAGNFFILADGTLLASGSTTTKAVSWAFLDPSNHAVVGKGNTKLIVRMSVACAVAPAITFSGELASLTFGGSTGNIVPSFGSQQGSAANVASPSGSSVNVAESASGSFVFPTPGAYAPVINLSGASAANSATTILWQLFVLNN
jgi:hypothetical protein